MIIFQKVATGPVAVNDLARMLPVSRPAVSQHLKVLKEAGLVTDTGDGTRRLYQLNPEGVARLRAHFDRMWTSALSGFKTAAEKPEAWRSAQPRARRQRYPIAWQQAEFDSSQAFAPDLRSVYTGHPY